MITCKEFKKRMSNAWNSDDDINKRLMVIEDAIEEILGANEE